MWQPSTWMVMWTGTNVTHGDRNSHMKFKSMCVTPWKWVWCGVMHDCVTEPFFFCRNSVIQAFTWICYGYILFHKLLAWNKKKVKFCLNYIMLHHTSLTRYQIPLMSHSLIGELEKLDHFHGPHKVQTSYHQILSVEMCKRPCLHTIIDLSHLLERTHM